MQNWLISMNYDSCGTLTQSMGLVVVYTSSLGKFVGVLMVGAFGENKMEVGSVNA